MIIYLGMATLFLSCKRELNALPTQAKVEGNVIIDQKSAEVALNGAYLRFAEGGNDSGTPSVRWAQNHEIRGSWLAGYMAYPYGKSTFDENFSITANDIGVGEMWAGSYMQINAANGVIEQVGYLDDTQFSGKRKAEIVAEARILRAYGHQHLLRYFTQFYDQNSPYGLLIRKNFVTTNNISLSRSSVKESYEFILSDLDAGIADAPLKSENHYTNKWVAKALKARVLMIRGGSGDYQQVINLTKDIIENSPYRLEVNLKDIFSTKGLSSTEVMLGIIPKVNQMAKSDVYVFYGEANYSASQSLRDLISSDPRSAWIVGDLSGTIGITKYLGGKVEVSYPLRLTEMYLLQAEAIVRSGGDIKDARSLLKIVQQHAGLTNFAAADAATTPETMLGEIYNETVKNLCFEDGQEWSALLRFPLATVLSIRPTIMDKNHYILPIPSAEFDKNPIIGPQNPGYSKN